MGGATRRDEGRARARRAEELLGDRVLSLIALDSGAGPEEMGYRVVGSSVHPVTTERANADVIGDAPYRLDGAHSAGRHRSRNRRGGAHVMADVIQASGLVKIYGKVHALDGLDLAVPEGTILGLLGPNGAGKTTAVRILTTLIQPDAGTATVAGIDVTKDPAKVRAQLGLSGQYAAVDEYLTGYENLDMVGRLYGLGRRPSKERARELLEQFRLAEAGDRPVKTYSGGMRRRLDLAGALVAKPPVLFLDEPTTGLDPRSRTEMWDVIIDMVKGGTTLLLTTQYLEEADQLANNILVIDHGKAIAEGTADELKAQVGGERIEIVLSSSDDLGLAHGVLSGVISGAVDVDDHARRLTAPVTNGATVLMEALRRLDAEDIKLSDVALRRPTLDDVFLTLTGHMSEEPANGKEVKQ
jgi:ABC-2 type transport system ATP-binding protein